MYRTDLIKFTFLNVISLFMICGLYAADEAVTQPLEKVLSAMQKKYDVVFSYNTKAIKGVEVNFELKQYEELEVAISRALSNTGLEYKYLGLNFYVIHKNNISSKRKIKKLKRKIKQIEKLGDEEDLLLYNESGLSKVARSDKYYKVQGRITDTSNEPLIGATIFVKGGTQGTTADISGNYELIINDPNSTLEISYTGCKAEHIALAGRKTLDVQLEEGLMLESMTVLGTRGESRTYFNSAVGIDHLSLKELKNVASYSLDDKLKALLPSFHSGQHPVSDASAHFNPVGLRGLLPSRTLVLVNGKRKNSSALLYSYVTASRGEVGVDMKSINADAIGTVEILKDGAAAQYGSDAIAGVINLSLQNEIAPFINMGYSTTSELDGVQYNASGGFTIDLLDKGFATLTFGYFNQRRSQRAGEITSAADEAEFWHNDNYDLSYYEDFLERNPSSGFQVGLPDIQSFNLSYNSALDINTKSGTQLYSFGTLMNRTGKSPQFARSAYWVDGFNDLYPNQDFFLPEMAPKINDFSFTVGLRHNWNNWNMDASSTLGRNSIHYYIENSFNQSLGALSPKNFYNGAHSFSHLVNNVDVKRSFELPALESLTLALGLEQRLESFKSEAGEFASYGDGTPNEIDRIGSESFSGLTPADELSGIRHNIGFYVELTSDISKRMRLGVASRFENYSDFGTNLSWKANGLLKIIPEKINLRGSFSSGFRAPSLHQIHYSSTTTTLTPQGIVQNRILNNLDPSLQILDIPRLSPETAINASAGLGLRLSDRLSLTADLYRIRLKNRIVLSGQVGRQLNADSPINDLLDMTNTSSAGFFLNAVNTDTKGIDVVLSLRKINLGQGKLRSTIAANFSNTRVTNVNMPDFAVSEKISSALFSREDVSRIESWRPQEKIIGTLAYDWNNLSTSASINYFGPVTYRHSTYAGDDVTYSAKTTVDMSMSLRIRSNVQVQVGVQNLFNIYPDSFKEGYQGVPNDRSIDFVGRFEYPWRTIQLGIDGTRGFSKVMLRF